MDCAKCSGELIKENIVESTVYRCNSCFGLFLEKGSFAKLIRDNNKNSIQEEEVDGDSIANDFKGVCPKCNLPLKRQKRNGNMVLDICSNCEGLWFDEGEFSTIDESTDKDYNPVYIAKFLMKKLGEAIKEKEKIAKQKKIKSLEGLKNDIEYLNAEGVLDLDKSKEMISYIEKTQSNLYPSSKSKKLIEKLNTLLKAGLISKEQFESNKKNILRNK